MDWINWSYVLIVPIAVGSLIAALVLVWWERRLLGWWQDRLGPNRVGWFGVLQALADAIKLFTKDDWIPPFGDRFFFVLAPFIVAGSMLMAYVVLPLGPGLIIADSNIAILWFLAMSSLAVYGVLLAGLASNNKYALLGGLRAAAQMVTYEVFMGLSLMGVVIHAQSFSLVDIVNAQEDGWFIFPQVIGFFIFTIAGLAESHRLPFDLPEAEQELVAGFHTEYTGMKFAMFFMGEYINMVTMSALVTLLFLGGWNSYGIPIWPIVAFAGKVVFLLCVFIWLRSTFPRIRYDRLMTFGWKVLLPLCLLNLLITGTIKVL